MKKGFKKTIFIIAVCLVLLELCLQAAGLILTPRAKKSDFTKNTFNILCIGDSFTYGIGAPQEDSYPRQLERLLQQEYKEADIRVINRGISGYNSAQCLKLLKEEFNTYNPKIILVMAGLNNCWNMVESGYFELKFFKDTHPVKYWIHSLDELLSRLKIYKLIKIYFFNLSARFKSASVIEKPEPLPGREFPAPQRSPELNALIDEGRKYYAAGKYELAEEYCLKAIEMTPEEFEPHWLMGRILFIKEGSQASRNEFILALKYAWDPILVADILADIQDRQQSRNSQDFKSFSALVAQMRPLWVSKFGEDHVQRLIDPQVLSDDDILSNAMINDFKEMRDYLSKNKADLLVLNYPHPPAKFRLPSGIYKRISAELNLSLVNNTAVFNKYLLKSSFDELFSGDGHCTSQGYKIIAENALVGLKKNNLLPRRIGALIKKGQDAR